MILNMWCTFRHLGKYIAVGTISLQGWTRHTLTFWLVNFVFGTGGQVFAPQPSCLGSNKHWTEQTCTHHIITFDRWCVWVDTFHQTGLTLSLTVKDRCSRLIRQNRQLGCSLSLFGRILQATLVSIISSSKTMSACCITLWQPKNKFFHLCISIFTT